jgi:predicted dinucleotide-binding enzyme
MQVGIIGCGKVGSALGAWFTEAGYSVSFTSRNQTHAVEAARFSGLDAKSTSTATLIRESDVIFLTLPFGEEATPSRRLANTLFGKSLLT